MINNNPSKLIIFKNDQSITLTLVPILRLFHTFLRLFLSTFILKIINISKVEKLFVQISNWVRLSKKYLPNDYINILIILVLYFIGFLSTINLNVKLYYTCILYESKKKTIKLLELLHTNKGTLSRIMFK